MESFKDLWQHMDDLLNDEQFNIELEDLEKQLSSLDIDLELDDLDLDDLLLDDL